MAPFQRKYTPEQIAATVSAVLDSGLRPADAIAAAAAGRLPGRWEGLPAFEMREGTLLAYCTDERRRRRAVAAAGDAPREVLNRAVGEVAAILDREVERLRSKSNRERVTAADIREVAAAAREVAKLVRETPSAVAVEPKPGQDAKRETGKGGSSETGTPDFIGALATEPGTMAGQDVPTPQHA